MRKHIPHPVTRLSSPYAELDLLYGGNEADAMEESMKIACDLRDVLRDEENILYVNTLVSELRMAYVMGKRFDHGARRGRNYFVTYCSGEIIDKLSVMRHMTELRKYKYLVINGFELAALTPRHRAEFMAWLRMMRNLGVNVILFTLSQPRHYGTLGSLRYSARSVQEVGAYLAKSNGQQYEDHDESTEPTQASSGDELLRSFEDEAPEDVIEEVPDEYGQEFADGPEATKLYAEITSSTYPETHRPEAPETQHPDSESLKTKDLALEYV